VIKESYLRNSVFGFEDGFVSTVGSLVGLAASAPNKSTVIISGLVIIAVEAFSMGVGAYLTEKSAHELSTTESHNDNLLIDSLVMWLSYMLAGFFVLSPYFINQTTQQSAVYSIGLTLIGLFALGFAKGKLVKRHPFKSGLEMMLVASIAIGLGYAVGEIGKSLLLNVRTP
jgi:VIT1/CCC1 family predicted Fe2+/Mn2+ transporter